MSNLIEINLKIINLQKKILKLRIYNIKKYQIQVQKPALKNLEIKSGSGLGITIPGSRPAFYQP